MANLILPGQSDLALALREPALLVPGRKPGVELKPKRKLLAWYLANSNFSRVFGLSATINNKNIIVQNGETAAVPTGSASSIAALANPSSGAMTIIQRVKFPLTNNYEMFLYGTDTFDYLHPLIGNPSNGSLNVWTGTFTFLISVSGYSGFATLVSRHTGGKTDIFTSRGDYALNSSYGYVGWRAFWGDPATAGRSPSAGSLFACVDGWLSDGECREAVRNPFAFIFEPANSSPYLISIPGGATPTLPVLSAPTLVWVSGNTYKPQVTATYGWSPSALFAASEEGGWYEPGPTTCYTDDGVTAAGENDLVYRMDDLSGNGNHLIQATEAQRPALRKSGSLWYLEFDGTSDNLSGLPGLSIGTDYSVVCAWPSYTSTGDWLLYHIGTGGVWIGPGLSGSTSIYLGLGAVTYDATFFDGSSETFNTRGALYTLYEASNIAHFDVTPTATYPTSRIGFYNTYFEPTRVGAFFVRDGQLSASERSSLTSYFAGKVGVTL